MYFVKQALHNFRVLDATAPFFPALSFFRYLCRSVELILQCFAHLSLSLFYPLGTRYSSLRLLVGPKKEKLRNKQEDEHLKLSHRRHTAFVFRRNCHLKVSTEKEEEEEYSRRRNLSVGPIFRA